MNNIKKLVFMSLLVAQSLVLYIIELYMPNPLTAIAPGAKLGLANIVTLVSLNLFGFKESIIILSIRILMASIFAGGASAFLYSITGGLFSLISMYLFIKFDKFNMSILGISIIGAVFHNVGQLLTSSIIIHNIDIFMYLPFLLLSSIPTGIFIGLASKFMYSKSKIHIKHIGG